MATRLKKCKACGKQFKPFQPLQMVCDYKCATAYVAEQNKKKAVKETREAKQSLKTRSEWLKEAQVWFNKFIRLRDDKEPCISCGRHHTGQYHAGHYRSVGASPELRFNELNCHKQCSVCNNHLSGNAINYRINLVKKIGIERVEWLEGKHSPSKLDVKAIKELKKLYQQKCKTLKGAV